MNTRRKLRRTEMQRMSRDMVADSHAARMNPKAAKIATEVVIENWPDARNYRVSLADMPSCNGQENQRYELRNIFRRYTLNQIKTQYGNPVAIWFAYQIACIVIKLLMKRYWPRGDVPILIDDSLRPKTDAGRTHEPCRDQGLD
jgi:hypothetical protein